MSATATKGFASARSYTREETDREAAGRGGSATCRLHHPTEAAADDDRARFREEEAGLLRSREARRVGVARPGDRDDRAAAGAFRFHDDRS